MRAFILLGLNCGYGTADIGRLRIEQIDFENQWLGELRGKTGIARGAWLWDETVEALRDAISRRPITTHERLHQLVFLTKSRRPWWEDGSTSHPLSRTFKKLKDRVGVNKKGVGQYALRHCFETVAGDCRDQQAIDYVMGHIDSSIGSVYREGIYPVLIKAVCSYVRCWWLSGASTNNRDLK